LGRSFNSNCCWQPRHRSLNGGVGPTLHVVGGDVLDSPQTLQFGPNQGTFHIDSGFPYNPIGAFAHWLLNMTKAGGYPKC
jgi:hypothetical protein